MGFCILMVTAGQGFCLGMLTMGHRSLIG